MVARVVTVAFHGVEARRVDVEVQMTSGASFFTVVGLADKAVGESRERVRAAFGGLGLSLPAKHIVVNLAPADLPKEGSHYDLPIALVIMAALGVIPPDSLADWVALGELGLDGRIAPVAGVLPAAVAASALGLGLICPDASGPGGRLGRRLPRVGGQVADLAGQSLPRAADPEPAQARPGAGRPAER